MWDLLGIALVLYALIWWLNKQRDKKDELQFAEYEKEKLSDESVLKQQSEFEEDLENSIDLPDGIRGKEAYIYWNLMRGWFGTLLAQNHYDESKSTIVKKDILSYMYLLKERRTKGYLSLELEDKEKCERYSKDADEAYKQIELIENAVAASIGIEAIESLEHARSCSFDSFDRTGMKPIAPEGFKYFPKTFSPYSEECIPVIKHD